MKRVPVGGNRRKPLTCRKSLTNFMEIIMKASNNYIPGGKLE
jgi:hypothetical protein